MEKNKVGTQEFSQPLVAHKITGVPIKHLRSFLRDCAKTKGADHLISVGSGTGCYEFEMTEGLDDLRARLILVDPSPDSFRHAPPNHRELRPHFSTTTELVRDRPQVVGKCLLLLIWPLPNEATYDLESIEILKPLSILLLYEKNPEGRGGAAGSYALHERFFDNLDHWGYKNIVEARYKKLSGPSWSVPFGFAPKFDVRLTWLSKRGSQIPTDRPCESIRESACRLAEW